MLNKVIYILVVIAVLFVFLYKLKFKTKDSGYSLDKDTTNVLKGYSIIIIIIHHLVLRMSNPGMLLPFRIGGYIGVSIFFFLSGYGLVCAAKGREKKYSQGFMVKRIQKIYFPAVFMQFVYMLILLLCFDKNYTVFGFIKGNLTLYPVDTSQWYIISLFLWYFVFWLLLKLNISWNKRILILFVYAFVYMAVCLMIGLTKNWIDTSLCFVCGAAFSVYKEKCTEIIQKHLIMLPISFIVFGITVFFSFGRETDTALVLRIISTIALLVIVLMILRFVDVTKNKISAYIGTISLECYLIHGKVIRVVKLCFENVGGREVLIYLGATVLVTSVYISAKKYLPVCFGSKKTI